MCREAYWIRSLLQIVSCECTTARVGGARPSTIEAWQSFLLNIRNYLKEWLLCSCCPSLSPSLLIEPWDVEYVSAVLFCFILDILLCCVWKKKKKIVDNKKKRRHLFQGRPCIFQQDNAKPHSAHITKSWLRRKRVRVLDWPACSPDLSPIENVWRILKRKMRQRRPRTVAHLKTCLQEEWDKITPETLHHLVSSVPKRLLSVVKRNGNITKW